MWGLLKASGGGEPIQGTAIRTALCHRLFQSATILYIPLEEHLLGLGWDWEEGSVFIIWCSILNKAAGGILAFNVYLSTLYNYFPTFGNFRILFILYVTIFACNNVWNNDIIYIQADKHISYHYM